MKESKIVSKKKYTPKDKQKVLLRDLVEKWESEFKERYPSRTIGHHHYVRTRDLEQFLYDFASALLKERNVFLD
jgi:hypothetical protein